MYLNEKLCGNELDDCLCSLAKYKPAALDEEEQAKEIVEKRSQTSEHIWSFNKHDIGVECQCVCLNKV